MDIFYDEIEKGFAEAKIPFSAAIADKFKIYYDMLIAYNKKMNLTAITDMQQVIKKHFIDSLLPLSCGFLSDGARCVDVGTGAGFPGIPIAIMRPDLDITLMDSLKKRLVFLDALKDVLKLQNCRTVHARAEDAAKGMYRETFDIALSRALCRLSGLSELCLPLVKEGGYMLALKSVSVEEEAKEADYAITLLGGRFEKIYGNRERNIAVIKKIDKTPSIYPRKAGTPEKYPLLLKSE